MSAMARFLIAFLLFSDITHSSQEQQKQKKRDKYAVQFFELASQMYHSLSSGSNRSLSRLHLIRVPKASSTALSVVARRFVGCQPRGPCCKYPGDPIGSCPSNLLYACKESGKVIGCVHHNPNLRFLYHTPPQSLLSLSMLRHPHHRSISGFFYAGKSHNNALCTDDIGSCYIKYATDITFSNVAVRMFSGSIAYQPSRTCRNKDACRHSLDLALQTLRRITFVGISELWEFSMLLLHSRIPEIEPVIEDFALAEQSSLRPEGGVRFSTTRKDFEKYANTNYSAYLIAQNDLDLELYTSAVSILCDRAQALGLWNKYDWVRRYWKSRLDEEVRKQVGNCNL